MFTATSSAACGYEEEQANIQPRTDVIKVGVRVPFCVSAHVCVCVCVEMNCSRRKKWKKQKRHRLKKYEKLTNAQFEALQRAGARAGLPVRVRHDEFL